MRQIKVLITAETSTGYTECDSMPLLELCAFYDDLEFYLQQKAKLQKGGS